ncbi:hypothetical protein HY357_01685 [Candidatus Roizmanbacteria bacterium]|nr:hypothetical protein [Candidatus Roizmanbacteria bacterium]
MNLLERYQLRGKTRDFDFSYDRNYCMPPDVVSERIGEVAGQTVNKLRNIRQDLNRAVKVLEMGIGTGLMSVSLLATV